MIVHGVHSAPVGDYLRLHVVLYLPPRADAAGPTLTLDAQKNVVFLNHGSFGAVPRVVFDAQTEWRRRIEAEPIELIARRGEKLIEEAKGPIGAAFGMKPSDFGFATNATDGINAVLRSLTFSPGDELLTTDHVYHAVRQTMKQIARQAGAACREVAIPLPVASSQQIADLVINAISPKTRLLVIDHVTSPTALIFPVEQIAAACRERGVMVLVDGAHAPGMIHLDVEKIGADFYAANLHKWTCAPKGTAFLWVTPQQQPQIHPAVISHNLDQGLAKEFAWQGTRDLGSWLTAPAAIQFMQNLGWEKCMVHNHALATWAHQLLVNQWSVEPISPLDGSLLGSMVTVELPGRLCKLEGQAAIDFQQQLYSDLGFELPVVIFSGRTMIRVSCHVYNRPEEYERLAEALLKFAAKPG